MSPTASLTIVLPAYNEADRIGPALDELFGYLRRRGELARDGSARGRRSLPQRIEVLVVDDGSTDGTAAIVAARPGGRGTGAPDGTSLRVLRVPARRQGRGGPGRDAGRDRGPGRLRRRRHGDPARPAAAPRRGAGRPRRRARVADPARRLATCATSQPRYRRLLGQGLPRARLGLGRRPGPGHAVRVQGLHPRRPRTTSSRASRSRSIVFDVELIYLARRRGYRIAIVPIRWDDRRGSRMRPRPGLALRVAWDLFRIPLLHRGVHRVAARPDDPPTERGRWLGPLCRSSRSCVFGLGRGRDPGDRRRDARATTSRPIARPPSVCSTASRCTTRRRPSPAAFAIFLYPPPFALAWSCRSRCSATRPGCGPGPRC